MLVRYRVRVAVIAAAMFGSAACGTGDDILPNPADACTMNCVDARLDAAPVVFDAMVHPDALQQSEGPDNVALLEPITGDFLIAGNVSVKCRAEPDGTSNSPVETVRFDIDDVAGTRVSAIGASSAPNEWSSVANVSYLINGPLTVSCVAVGADGFGSSDTKVANLDLGPRIVINSPLPGQAVHGQITLDFAVTPWPVLMPTDTQADVDYSTMVVLLGSEPIPLTAPFLVGDGMGHFQGTIQADDPNFFVPPLDGDVTLSVSAENMRAPTPVRRTAERVFNVDNTPPDIIILSPESSDLVGGIMTVTATVADPHGVDPTNVVGVFGNGAAMLDSFPLMHIMGDVYVGSYDVRKLRHAVEVAYEGACGLDTDGVGGIDCPATGPYGTCPMGHPCTQVVFPTLSVRGRDLAGNEGVASHLVTMDYTPPIASLDPPQLREGFFSALTGHMACNFAFDPLGNDAVDDFQAVPQLAELRARVEDQGNIAASLSGVGIANAQVNPATVQIFILDDTSGALIVDTDGDGICDEINPELNPTTVPMSDTDALAVNLVPVAPQGVSLQGCDISAGPCDGSGPYNTPFLFTNAGAACWAPPPPDLDPGPPRCATTSLQRVIKLEVGMDPAIYTLGPVSPLSCVGTPIDFVASNIQDGWACAAVRAEDTLGNVGISKVLRVCIDHDGDGVGSGCADPTPPFLYYPDRDSTYDLSDVKQVQIMADPGNLDCSGVYNPMTMTTNAAVSCIPPLDFPDNEIRRNDL